MYDEQKELEEIQKNIRLEAEVIRNALDNGAYTEEAKKNLKSLYEINKNLDLTIVEQRSLINTKNSVSESYKQILRDSFVIKSFERMNFEQDIMVRLRNMGEGLGDAAYTLLTPLVSPEFVKKFSIENFYASSGNISNEEEDKGLSFDEENMEIEELDRKRNETYMEICTSFFAFMQGEASFEIKKYIRSLTVDEIMRWNKENALPNTLMTIYQKKEIDLESVRGDQGLFAKEPLGEFDLLWVLSNLPRTYLNMKKITFSTSNETCKFTVDDEINSMTIEMTNFVVEVER